MLFGLWQHFWLTLRHNFRSARSIGYGYVMPVIFLLGFGSVFRAGEPLLLAQMGQILTITILGGACLGMPTALVAERERGVWRRYQLLPISTSALLANVILVRVVIVVLAVLLQIVLARLIYGTPFPLHPFQFAVGYLFVVFAFLGLGIIVTALANDVPAVQALGQCLFLPMILIGGVGVPLIALPDWAQRVASFMPGRYAVEVLQSCYEGSTGLSDAGFALVALVVIGAASTVAGLKLMRWEQRRRIAGKAWAWIGLSLAAWASVGMVALSIDRVAPVDFVVIGSYEAITPEQIARISYEVLPDDRGIYTPLAPPMSGRRLTHRMQEFLPRLEEWAPGRQRDIGQSVRNLLSVAAIADIIRVLISISCPLEDFC